MFTIGQLAKAAGVNVETIRYYERQHLIEQPVKPSLGGYRQYTNEALITIQFIKRAQHLGFTLSEISTLLELSEARCQDVQVLAEAKLKTVKQKLKDLKRLEKSLKLLVEQCNANTNDSNCPIIQSLVDTNIS